LKTVYATEKMLSASTEDLEIEVTTDEPEMPEDEPVEESKEESKVEELKDEEDIVDDCEIPDEPVAKKAALFTSPVTNEIERNLDIRMATTFKLIMNTYSNMREFTKADRFEEQARRMFKSALGDD